VNGRAVLKFAKRHERAILLVVLLVAVPLARMISEYAGRIRAGGLTAVGQRSAMGRVRMVDVQGNDWRLEDHRGQVVAINLWATWCGPCLEEAPALVRVAREVDPKDVAVVGLALDSGGATEENKGKVAEFARHFGVGYPLVFPVGGVPMELEVGSIPTTILVDREGRVAKTYGGPVTAEVLEADVRQVLRGG
jgi:cytochrome c biogenesis protein CcmG/thiol:disulfide interchange protein DsbE